MAMPAQHTEWTVEMVRALPDDGLRYEGIDGLPDAPALTIRHEGGSFPSKRDRIADLTTDHDGS